MTPRRVRGTMEGVEGYREERVAPGVILWVSGPVCFGASILACRVEDDSVEDPHYFGTIVRGLRDEWHHHDSTA